ncbi:Transposon En/Spm-like [Arabidopsis suecica]|uniref:Transposon En/Spm-like n=1 Tax=Arabidopsis suecica TaxID=45249 RepID=A0A8T1ZE07_ARASU|nr:Transposon En/Spm-like [Arabidopsis suecica]
MWNNLSREWMYNRIDPYTNHIATNYLAGVEAFISYASHVEDRKGRFLCPCVVCQNSKSVKAVTVSSHLLSRGFMPNYYVWYEHGEDYNVVGEGTSNYADNTDYTSNYADNTDYTSNVNEPIGFHGENIFAGMVNDAFHGSVPYNEYHEHESGNDHVHEEPTQEAKRFYDMLAAANTPLYDGCREGQSQLSLAARFMNNKVDYNLSESCMDGWAELFTEYLPEGNQATGSYYETETLMRKLGLPYHTYDVCIDNCMLFWKEYAKLGNCKFCGKPRYKESEGRTRIPFSKMWYLPIGDRLKRMYQSEKTAASMRWHAEHESEEGLMCHPSDAAEWKNFQQLHPSFAEEPRNVYLGLCTDGFNPFGMSKNHSLWPVILTPYNLPPDMCMKSEYLFLTILNSGPNYPRASLDVFLQPLIDELQELWHNGVEAYDVSLDQNFNLKAVLLWTISDFPAYGMLSGCDFPTYGMLSGWTTHGRLSCPICMEDTNAFWLPGGRKTCWFDCHRRFLPVNHSLRKDKTHFLKGKGVKEYPPQSLTGEQVLYERIRTAEPPMTSDCGGNGHEKKVDGYGQWHNWHKESILWQLPYWVDLNLRHNLDVMHIEKNVLDNIIYTVMNVKDKSKDTVRSRIDVSRFCDWPELHVDDQGKAPFPIWRLSAKAKKSLLEWVKSEVKFPDGYVADLASCADINAGKFSGMKSHDSHVCMERLLPFVFAELLPRNVHLALSGLGAFFRDLSTRSLELSRVQNLKENIVMILCNLEKIFPPSFFDVMEHLPVHLPDEAELGGPVQYRWMYPFERSSRYDAGDVPVYPIPVPDIFTQVGRPSGKSSEFWLTEIDYKCAHAYVLRNCDYFRPLESVLEAQIRYDSSELSDDEVLLKRDEDFPMWIRQYITLFYCEWYDPTVGKGVRIGNGGKSSRGRGGGANTRQVAAGGGANTRQVAAGGGANTRQVAAGGGQTTRRVAAGGGQALSQEAAGGGETSRLVASRARVRTFVGHRPPVTASGVGTSSHSSNPSSASQSATQSQVSHPSLNPPLSRQTPPLNRQTSPPPQPQHQPPSPQTQPLPEHDANHQVLPENEDLEEEEIDDVGQEDDEENPNPGEDYQDMLDRLLALPGREHLPRLSVHPIPNVETFWLNRQKGVLSRAISRIFRRKFDGPYYSWKVTPINIQERYFRTFAREFNWDTGITALVKQGFLVIAQKRMKGIVSQVITKGVQPTWIRLTLWTEMQNFWKTADAIERSENASQCRNSDRGGLGVHKHLAGQKSFIQVHQEMEEELGRPVSLGEVFMRTHTRADGSFVDQKSEQVAEAYKKTVEERLAELEEDVQDASEISSEHSMHPRELSIDEMNDIFLKCTHTDDQGNPYGLGSLVETLHKGKRKESYASSSSTVTVVELQEQLRRKISNQDAENARRDEEHRKSQARIASLEKLILFMKDKDPDLAAFMSTSPLLEPEVLIPPTTTTTTLPATTGAAVQPAGHTTGTTPTSPLSTASNQ